MLKAAYGLLQERASTIEDESLRRGFLENVPYHREIVTLWKRCVRGAPPVCRRQKAHNPSGVDKLTGSPFATHLHENNHAIGLP